MTDASNALNLMKNVDVNVSVELGRARLALKDVMALCEDAVVPLDRQVDELLDVLVNGSPIAKAEIITEGSRFALRIVSLIGSDDQAEAA